MKDRVWTWVIMAFSVLGAVAAGYALAAHYDTASSAFCSISDTFDCDIVNKSSYSKLFGVPVSLLGLLSYVYFFAAALIYRSTRSAQLLQWSVAFAVGGFLFSLYLTGIEAFVLYTWCLLCLTSQLSILLVMIGFCALQKGRGKSSTTLHS